MFQAHIHYRTELRLLLWYIKVSGTLYLNITLLPSKYRFLIPILGTKHSLIFIMAARSWELTASLLQNKKKLNLLYQPFNNTAVMVKRTRDNSSLKYRLRAAFTIFHVCADLLWSISVSTSFIRQILSFYKAHILKEGL